jgi:hypothetical protein
MPETRADPDHRSEERAVAPRTDGPDKEDVDPRATDRSWEVQPSSPEDAEQRAEDVERLGRHTRPMDDGAGINPGRRRSSVPDPGSDDGAGAAS